MVEGNDEKRSTPSVNLLQIRRRRGDKRRQGTQRDVNKCYGDGSEE